MWVVLDSTHIFAQYWLQSTNLQGSFCRRAIKNPDRRLAGLPGLLYKQMNYTNFGQCAELCSVDIQKLDAKFSSVFLNREAKQSGGLRSRITRFSFQSRQRLISACRNREDFNGFITLTYPDETFADSATGGNYMTSGKVVKEHLRRFRQWLTRRDIGGIWFLEFQRRGAPHFHLVTTKALDAVQSSAASRYWAKLVGSQCPHHAVMGVNAQVMRKRHAAGAYAAKYSCKDEQKTVPQNYQDVGRFWGMFGLDEQETVYKTVSVRQILELNRLARRAESAHRRSAGLPPRSRSASRHHSSGTLYSVATVLRTWIERTHILEGSPQRIVLEVRRKPNPESLLQ